MNKVRIAVECSSNEFPDRKREKEQGIYCRNWPPPPVVVINGIKMRMM